MFYLIVVLVTIIDQGFKLWVRMNMDVGESIVIWNHILSFTHYQNSGAAGSTFQGYGRYFVIPAVVFIGYILYSRRKGNLKGGLVEVGTAFFVGGALGNAIDRILFGKVTDFIDFHMGHGILNIADQAINIGVVSLLLDALISAVRSRRRASV
ncbi:signal peptidase II [Paenibacillus sp. LMG 31456]|uniref:Lipoprotein signal peptidase n=1 Tax=Paenibacillus foliorum TaxID=2654974 RepID=A0A972K4B5_9BACL|nr:signal peptidase II [Paenibacillus foliorum]NOU96788.1 signal peptidase II [Paenibacillus foliorum]